MEVNNLAMLEGSMVKVGEKNTQTKKRSKVSIQKRLTVVQCWLTHGQKLDEETQPIIWTKQVHWQVLVHSGPIIRYVDCQNGQNEPVATNALVGRSIHWMGYIFSFGIKWGSSQSIFFRYWPLYFFFGFFFVVFSWT
jgi:hypothetical protein